MNKVNFKAALFLLITMSFILGSCQAIGDIFKAGVWVGIIVVVAIVAIIFWLVSKAGNKS